MEMPYKNPKNCMHIGCNRLVMQGRYCVQHKINTQQFRRGKDWEELRQQVLEEEPICRICGKSLSTEVEHIIPLPKGPTERWNLRGACKSCHSKKTRVEVSR